jgi:hypothetical protein
MGKKGSMDKKEIKIKLKVRNIKCRQGKKRTRGEGNGDERKCKLKDMGMRRNGDQRKRGERETGKREM